MLGLQRVKLEDSVFNQKYAVFSTDQTEARYLLTPSFMERLLNSSALFAPFNNNLRGKTLIECSFFDNKFLIAIPCYNNLFNVSQLFKPMHTDCIKVMLMQFRLIFGIIEELKLHQDIGM